MASEVKANKISPATGTAFTFGDSGDTFTVPSGATITNSGTANGFGGGKVLQVISTEYSTVGTTTSTTFVTTGLEASITPASTSNKILMMASVSIGGSGAVGDNRCMICFLRNTTELGVAPVVGSRISTARSIPSMAGGQMAEESILYLDSPSSTSAITYKLAYKARSSFTVSLNKSYNDTDNADHERGVSTIVLMEIEG
jgi:hypothetical protein